MCKFKKPEIPANITADERRSLMFNALSSLDLNDKLEKRDNDKLSYLSWANAWAEFKVHIQVQPTKLLRIPTPTCLTSQTRMLVLWCLLRLLLITLLIQCGCLSWMQKTRQ